MLRGVSRTGNRTGVLVFVSLAEHYVRIVADEAIAQKVHGSEWQAAVDALTAHMRSGRIAAGLNCSNRAMRRGAGRACSTGRVGR